ncbi:MAG: hypothetical protein SPI64_06905 [Anaerovibrio sp.]|nr:hypothetical protein [Selenomonadaceae bacterium]MDD6397189.1 hypothetical protein [Selenomonadaceae bacterium]MDY6053832.1 hypothetical protein [Anaerovibrio sp.]
MSQFMEQLMADLDVFVNEGEFAEKHEINGIEVPCLLEGLNTKQMLISISNSPDFDGINGIARILHIRTADLPDKVTRGNVVDVDGEVYRVGNIIDDLGISTISLEVDRL